MASAWRRRKPPRKRTLPPSCASKEASARTRHRVRLGRACPHPCPGPPRRCPGNHLCRANSWPPPKRARKPPACRIAPALPWPTTENWARRYDRIVSVGMFEHVSRKPNYLTFRDARRTLGGTRHRRGSLDRSAGSAGPDQPLHPQIHLPVRLIPALSGDYGGGRGERSRDYRHRNTAPALCRDLFAIGAGPLRGRTRSDRRNVHDERSSAVGCGSSISR